MDEREMLKTIEVGVEENCTRWTRKRCARGGERARRSDGLSDWGGWRRSLQEEAERWRESLSGGSADGTEYEVVEFEKRDCRREGLVVRNNNEVRVSGNPCKLRLPMGAYKSIQVEEDGMNEDNIRESWSFRNGVERIRKATMRPSAVVRQSPYGGGVMVGR